MFTPPKLPSSTVLAALDWQDTPEFWTSLRSYTNEINLSQRGTLVEIIRAYIHEVEFEQNATSVSDAEKRLGEIETAAEAFWRVLDCPSESIGREAAYYVEGLLNDYLEDRSSPDNPLRVSHLSHTMLTFVEGCDLARKQLEILKAQKGNYTPNTAWRSSLVGPLAEFWEGTLKRGRITIRKDTDKMKHGLIDAPFVAFVKAVESALPEQFRRPYNSPEAYQVAVSKAVSHWRKGSGLKPAGTG